MVLIAIRLLLDFNCCSIILIICYHQFHLLYRFQQYIFILFTKFFNSLLLFQRTDQQLSILLGYDIAIQALNYHLAFIGCMNHAVPAFIQADVLAYFGIASLILWKQGTEAAPAA